MTEAAEAQEAPEEGDPVRTGVADVDAVLEAVEELEGRPLEEHVAVFEDAHGRLRRALDDPGSLSRRASTPAARRGAGAPRAGALARGRRAS